MSEKTAAIKKFEYSPLSKELKAQISTAEKQYKKKGEKILKSDAKSDLVYSKDFTFYNTTALKILLIVLLIQNEMVQ